MDKNELERRLESAEKQNLGLIDEINLLKEKLSEIENSGEIPEFPVFERGTPYYTMNGEFEIEHGYHSGSKGMNHEEDDDLYNAFHTKEMAQEFAKKCKLIAMLLHCKWCVEKELFKFDSGVMGDYPPVYTVVYDRPMDEYSVVEAHVFEGSQVYFKSKDAAQKAADWLNKHWKENTDE